MKVMNIVLDNGISLWQLISTRVSITGLTITVPAFSVVSTVIFGSITLSLGNYIGTPSWHLTVHEHLDSSTLKTGLNNAFTWVSKITQLSRQWVNINIILARAAAEDVGKTEPKLFQLQWRRVASRRREAIHYRGVAHKSPPLYKTQHVPIVAYMHFINPSGHIFRQRWRRELAHTVSFTTPTLAMSAGQLLKFIHAFSNGRIAIVPASWGRDSRCESRKDLAESRVRYGGLTTGHSVSIVTIINIVTSQLFVKTLRGVNRGTEVRKELESAGCTTCLTFEVVLDESGSVFHNFLLLNTMEYPDNIYTERTLALETWRLHWTNYPHTYGLIIFRSSPLSYSLLKPTCRLSHQSPFPSFIITYNFGVFRTEGKPFSLCPPDRSFFNFLTAAQVSITHCHTKTSPSPQPNQRDQRFALSSFLIRDILEQRYTHVGLKIFVTSLGDKFSYYFLLRTWQ